MQRSKACSVRLSVCRDISTSILACRRVVFTLFSSPSRVLVRPCDGPHHDGNDSPVLHTAGTSSDLDSCRCLIAVHAHPARHGRRLQPLFGVQPACLGRDSWHAGWRPHHPLVLQPSGSQHVPQPLCLAPVQANEHDHADARRLVGLDERRRHRAYTGERSGDGDWIWPWYDGAAPLTAFATVYVCSFKRIAASLPATGAPVGINWQREAADAWVPTAWSTLLAGSTLSAAARALFASFQPQKLSCDAVYPIKVHPHVSM
jgi:hypothetical protein